ncbi:MAG: hypothetical protein Q8Q20_03370 [bacterium]|nr:hypothetical protein [bacterium]
MILQSRILVFLAPLLIGGIMEFALVYPDKVFPFFSLLCMLGVVVFSVITKRPRQSEQFIFFLNALLFNISALAFIYFIQGELYRHIIIAGVTALNVIYLHHLFNYHFRTDRYQLNALQNVSSYINLSSAFTGSAVLFSLIIYLAWPAWTTTIILWALATLLSFQTTWMHKIKFSTSMYFALISGLVLTEVYWVVSFLPSSFLVNALIVTVVYYAMVNIGRYYLSGRIHRAVIIRYFVISVTVLVLTVVTARWV